MKGRSLEFQLLPLQCQQHFDECQISRTGSILAAVSGSVETEKASRLTCTSLARTHPFWGIEEATFDLFLHRKVPRASAVIDFMRPDVSNAQNRSSKMSMSGCHGAFFVAAFVKALLFGLEIVLHPCAPFFLQRCDDGGQILELKLK